MMWRVAVSSKTSSFASGGSPIHSTECVSHGFGGFSTYCITEPSALAPGQPLSTTFFTLIRTRRYRARFSLNVCRCNCYRLNGAECNEHRLPGRAGSLSQANVVIRDLSDPAGIDPARNSLHV